MPQKKKRVGKNKINKLDQLLEKEYQLTFTIRKTKILPI
jgi:hypothetical protein